MRCVSPVRVKTKKSVSFVPCGKCNFCLESKREDWTFRLSQEHKEARTSFFITLTYDDSKLVTHDERTGEFFPNGTLVKRDLTLFFKRLRKANEGKFGDDSYALRRGVRYYAVGEYGTNSQRAHYHAIVFNVHPMVIDQLPRIWGLGLCHVGTVTQKSIHYVTKYVINRVGDFGGREPPFSFMSKRPGIGSGYLETHEKWHKDDTRFFTQVNGFYARIPRFYKDRLFDNANLRASKAVEQRELGEEKQAVELARLEKLRGKGDMDAFRYDVERTVHRHESFTDKVNKKNKF